MIDPMHQRLMAYQEQSAQSLVPRFRVGTAGLGSDGIGAADINVPGSLYSLSGVGIAPSSEIADGIPSGWPVLMIDGGGAKPIVLGTSPWQVSG